MSRGQRLLYPGPFITMFDRFAITPLLVPIAHDFHVPLEAVAPVATVYFLAYGLMQPVYGLLSDRFGRVLVLRLSLAGFALAGVLSSLAPSLAALIVLRAAVAGLASPVFPTAMVYIGDRLPFAERQRAIADVLMAVALGTATATLGAGLLATYVSWRAAFLLPAVLAAFTALLLGRLPESRAHQASAGPAQQLARVFRRPWAVFLILFFVVEGSVILGLFAYFPTALETGGLSAAAAGLVVSAYGVAVLLGTRVVRLLARRLGAPRLIALGGGCLVVAYVSAARSQQVPAILAASALVGFAYAFLHSSLQAWATDIAPDARGTATALCVTAALAGASLGIGLGAGLAGAGRWSELFLLAALVSLPVTLVGVLARARYPGSAPPEELPAAAC